MAIETQILLIYGAQSGFFDELDLDTVKGVKEYVIRLGEYSLYSTFINVNSKLKEFEKNAEALLEGAYHEFTKIKESL
jgi:F0F1-type ATP synthase alpha subunit